MTKRVKIFVADLFCGAGGTSTGLSNACAELGLSLDLLAVNHWDVAIATHSANYPRSRHLCETLDSVDPRKVIPGGHLKLMVASPECTHHSNARGGKPVSDQSRASASHVIRWAEALYIENILIENVREFRDWGPLLPKRDKHGHVTHDPDTGEILMVPDKKRKGETYQAFLAMLRSLGYRVEDRILNAADYGDPTTRERLFILARRGNKKIAWPEPTHHPNGETLFGKQAKWRAAREIIDWSVHGESIFNRRRPLSPNTLRRIAAGLKKFSGLPFVLPNEGFYRGNTPRSVDDPIPTITQRGAGALVQPFILNIRGGDDGYTRMSSIDEPLPTVTATSPTALVEPFIIPLNHGQGDLRSHSVDKPMPTITSVDAWGLVEPFIVMMNGTHESALKSSNRSVNQPLPTIVGSAPHLYLCEPFVIGQQSCAAPRSVEQPLPTVAAKGAISLVQPFLVEYHGTSYEGGERVRSVDRPLPTVATSNQFGLVQPFLVKYNGTGGPRSVDEPMDTLTSKERFGLVIPQLDGAVLDIRFRMLQPNELARAMSFPDDYKFSGNREQKVKQIGNAVPVNLAKSLCMALLGK